MSDFLPGLIMGFREGLEAFLIISIMIQYLNQIHQQVLKKNIRIGVGLGMMVSLLVGGGLFLLSRYIGNMEQMANLWESSVSLIALVFVTTFIVWMIKNGSNMAKQVQGSTASSLSKRGIIIISATMVAREGVEIAIFTFAGQYTLVSILAGISLALIFSLLIFNSMIKVNIRTIFNVTLVYLILQAGFLLGYGVHEGLSALKDLGIIASASILLAKAFDVSGTILYHKEGIIGLPLYILFGWYSRPEWIQFVIQYGYTITMLALWNKGRKNLVKT